VLGELVHPLVRLQLRRIFSYRALAVRQLFGVDTTPRADESPRFE
jgi:hypothetical protein